MANKNSRRSRRAASERKRRPGSGASGAAPKTGRDLLMQLALDLKAGGAGMPGQMDDEEDDETQDDETENKEGSGASDDEEMMGLDDDMLDALLGADDDEEGGDEEYAEDDEEKGDDDEGDENGASVILDADQLDAILDAALGVDDNADDEDVQAAVMSAKAKKLAARKRAAAQKVLAQLKSELSGVKLPASVKKLLIQTALRQASEAAHAQASKKVAQVVAKRKQEKQAERKRLESQRQLVDTMVEEKLMNTRYGRSFHFGGYETSGRDRNRGGREVKTFDRNRLLSLSQLSGQYRRGTPEFKLIDAYRALTNPEFRQGYIKEFKALGGATGSAGGFIVPEEWASDFIKLLRAKAVVRKFARVYPMGSDTLHLPAQAGATNAQWIAENADASSGATDQSFSEIVFTAKNLVAFSKVSNQLLADSTYDAEQIVREDLQKVVALKEDDTFLTAGTGSTTVPTSIYASIPGANILAGSGASQALAADDVYTLMNAVEENNAQVDVFVTSPTGLMKIRKLKDTTGNFIFSSAGGVNSPQPVIEAPYGSEPQNYGPVGYLLERPVYITTQVPKTVAFAAGAISALTGGTGTLLFAGQSEYAAIAQRAQIEILASNVAGSSFQNNQTWFRAILREDFALTIAGAWSVLGFA
jgi:HK97 family phage major capsid protein